MKRLLCAALLAAAATLPFVGVGCGPKMSTVECKVTLDGAPVEGAQVTFVPQDRDGLSASGITDSSGVCVMRTGSDKESVRAGKYKVTVSKSKYSGKGEGMDPTKAMEEAAKGGPKPGAGGPGGAGPKMPGGMMPGAGGAAGPASGMGVGMANDLPIKYTDVSQTPFEVTVPPSESPVKLAMTKQ
jgi:hypothetical protein